jgi:drug/metabolite transporter superfamily protein YnfA
MPFTFSHPALAIPIYLLYKRAFSLTGLIIGSITPDFEYFFRMEKGPSYYSHTLTGLLYFNLPVGLLIFLIFHRFVRRPLIVHLPSILFERFVPFCDLHWTHYVKGRWGTVLISILFGAATHLGWDGLVHEHGDFMYEWQHKLLFFQDWQHHTIIYTLTQSVHSLAGMIVLLIAVWWLPAKNQPHQRGNLIAYWGSVGVLTSVTVFLRLLSDRTLGKEDWAVAAMAAFLLAVLIISFLRGEERTGEAT